MKSLGSLLGIMLLTSSFAFAGQTTSATTTTTTPTKPAASAAKSEGQATTDKAKANAKKKRQKHQQRQAKGRAKAQASSQTPNRWPPRRLTWPASTRISRGRRICGAATGSTMPTGAAGWPCRDISFCARI